MTIFAKSHGSGHSFATTSSALPPRARIGGAFALSTVLHAGIAALLLFAAWSLREETTREKRFVLVQSSAGATTVAGPATDARSGEIPPTAPNFLAEMHRRQRAEERFAQQEIARMREQRRQEEAHLASANATPAIDQTSDTPAARPRTLARQTVDYGEFRQRNPLPRHTADSTRATGAPGARIDLREVTAPGCRSAGPGAGEPGADSMRAEARAMERYFGELVARLRASHEKPGGLSDLLSAEVLFTLGAGGAISEARIVRSSGSAEFDRSVLETFARVRMPARPDGKTDVIRLTFRLREA